MMSEAQMKSTAKLMRNVCQPKTKVTNAQIEDMHKGIFDDDSKAQCYMLCVLQMMKAMKNGKLDYEYALSAVSTLAPRYQEPTRVTLDNCKESVQSTDHCEGGYQLAKCMYFSNPEFYFLP
ncbi:Odorant-binding protein 19a [Carabus blaptoides fortunei]